VLSGDVYGDSWKSTKKSHGVQGVECSNHSVPTKQSKGQIRLIWPFFVWRKVGAIRSYWSWQYPGLEPSQLPPLPREPADPSGSSLRWHGQRSSIDPEDDRRV